MAVIHHQIGIEAIDGGKRNVMLTCVRPCLRRGNGFDADGATFTSACEWMLEFD